MFNRSFYFECNHRCYYIITYIILKMRLTRKQFYLIISLLIILLILLIIITLCAHCYNYDFLLSHWRPLFSLFDSRDKLPMIGSAPGVKQISAWVSKIKLSRLVRQIMQLYLTKVYYLFVLFVIRGWLEDFLPSCVSWHCQQKITLMMLLLFTLRQVPQHTQIMMVNGSNPSSENSKNYSAAVQKRHFES